MYEIEVPFGDCDPAGIVYFPRFFDYFHRTMEAWFGRGLGIAYHQVVCEQKIGFPVVHTEADFRVPSQFGDTLAIELQVLRLGEKSFTLAYGVRAPINDDSEVRLSGRTICAFVDLDPTHASFRKAILLPKLLRNSIETFMGQ